MSRSLEKAELIEKKDTNVVGLGTTVKIKYFGEMTLIHGAGTEKFSPETLGQKMGEWIKLPIR